MRDSFPVDEQTSEALKAIIKQADKKKIRSGGSFDIMWQEVQKFKKAVKEKEYKEPKTESNRVVDFLESLQLSYCQQTNGFFPCGLRITYMPNTKEGRNLYRQHHRQHHVHKHWRDPYSTYYCVTEDGCDERCMGARTIPKTNGCEIRKKTNLLIQYECGLIIPKYLTVMQNDVLAREHNSYHEANQPNRVYWLESTYYLKELLKEKPLGEAERMLDI